MESRMSNQEKPPIDPQRRFAGMPVSWDWKNWYKGVWNPQDDRLFPPRRVGIGWSINFAALLKKMGLKR